MPTDRIIYESPNGNIYYTYDAESDVFITLNLPNFMYTAPDTVKQETANWVRQCIKADREGKVRPKSKIIREYLDDPKTKQLRARLKRGYATLEDYQ